MVRRNLFSAYKMETDPETKEILRQAYLDETGMVSSKMLSMVHARVSLQGHHNICNRGDAIWKNPQMASSDHHL